MEVDEDTEGLHRPQGCQGVPGRQPAADVAGALGDTPQHDGPVADRFVTGNGDAAAQGGGLGVDKKGGHGQLAAQAAHLADDELLFFIRPVWVKAGNGGTAF